MKRRRMMMAGGKEEVDYSLQYFTLKALQAGTFKHTNFPVDYSVDGGSTWTTLSAGSSTSTVQAGTKVMFRGTITPNSSYGVGTFTGTNNFAAEGNVMSLLYGDNFEGQVDLTGKSYAFLKLFYNSTKLINAKKLSLPAITLRYHSYDSMFFGCTNLINPPETIAATTAFGQNFYSMFYSCNALVSAPKMFLTTVGDNECATMFCNCKSLSKAPELLATTVANSCYYRMFEGCTSLTTPPSILPATTLASNCYKNMFYYCRALITAPALPATTLATQCYTQMFYACTSLTTAPVLPATTLANSCYYGMFYSCTSLTTAPTSLPATTLADSCYYQMFYNCTSLTTAPVLPATTLANSCYYGMFGNTNVLPDCDNIDFTNQAIVATGGLIGLFKDTKVTDSNLAEILPINNNGKYYLPVLGLSNRTYKDMFSGCTSLTTAPELPATAIGQECYMNMFYNCRALTTPPSILPTMSAPQRCYAGMFGGCRALTTTPELPATTLAGYCYSGMFYECTSLTAAPALPATTLADGCYYQMFYGCTSLTTAPTSLPATTLATECYYRMFYNCTSLTTAPELPASMLVSNCYSYMFYYCRKLNYVKALFETDPNNNYTNNWLTNVSSSGTFVKNGVASWDNTGVSGVPSGWTVDYVYNYTEFSPSISLTPSGYVTFTATEDNSVLGIIRHSSYQTLYISKNGTLWQEMNNGDVFALNTNDEYYVCGMLTYSNQSSNYTRFIVRGGVSASGNCNAIWNYSDMTASLYGYCGYRLFLNCTGLTKAPDLLAETTVNACYNEMFKGCSKLNYIKAMFINMAGNTTYYWTSGVASSGTFVKNSAATWNVTGVNGVPSGWTVETAAA